MLRDDDEVIRPFTDGEYTLIVLQDIKRFMRKSELGLSWVHPRHWAASDADGREVIDALEFAIAAVRAGIGSGRSARREV